MYLCRAIIHAVYWYNVSEAYLSLTFNSVIEKKNNKNKKELQTIESYFKCCLQSYYI